MSDPVPAPGSITQQTPQPQIPQPQTPPTTGIAGVDDALTQLAGLSPTDLAEHRNRLAQAHEVLQQALQADPTPAAT